MRVVHAVATDSFAGVERYVADTGSELQRRGWDVVVVGGNATLMREAAPDVQHVHAPTSRDVMRALRAVGPVDVVHAHMTAAELPAALLAHRLRGPLIATRHFASPRGRSLGGHLVRPLIERRIARQIAISEFVAREIGEESVVVPNGVPSSDVEATRTRTVLLLQRLQPEKNTALALEAWRASGLADDGWSLRICGEGSEGPALHSLARDLGIDGSVTFAGFSSTPREELAAAGLLLATAPAEPFGLAVVEAMAMGTPVVAADGGAHPETLGPAGRLFAPGDVAACAAALRALADDPALRAELGAALRARQRALFSITVHVDALERVYADAISSR